MLELVDIIQALRGEKSPRKVGPSWPTAYASDDEDEEEDDDHYMDEDKPMYDEARYAVLWRFRSTS